MVDVFTPEKRSEIMSKIRGKNTKIEVLLRRLLFATGLRYRIHYGKHRIDIAFPSSKVAVFVDGCFWHKCPKHFQMPTSNVSYWKNKIARNVEREKEKDKELKKKGWKVIRVWEHTLKESPEQTASGIVRAVNFRNRKA